MDENIEHVEIDHGIRLVEGGKVRYLSFGTLDEAESARYDWDREVPTSQPQIVSRAVAYGEWELL